jgi:2-polyprenyl-6-hydroxyphenyl methylase/3-demethylubiquinone-9 3-methyltransferase
MARSFDRFLPDAFRRDGNRDFADQLVPTQLVPGALIYDVGGGKHPNVGEWRRLQLGLSIVGLDIDAEELAAAPAGAYERTICADISSYRGSADADLAICQAVLEHVSNTDAAMRALASIIKPGGTVLLFLPSRTAVYAALNRILPHVWKRWLLYRIYPRSQQVQGFPAYYDRCTPSQILNLARKHGLEVESARYFFYSDYFSFCFPLHVAWRMWQLLFRLLRGNQAAETFSLVLHKAAGKPIETRNT